MTEPTTPAADLPNPHTADGSATANTEKEKPRGGSLRPAGNKAADRRGGIQAQPGPARFIIPATAGQPAREYGGTVNNRDHVRETKYKCAERPYLVTFRGKAKHPDNPVGVWACDESEAIQRAALHHKLNVGRLVAVVEPAPDDALPPAPAKRDDDDAADTDAIPEQD